MILNMAYFDKQFECSSPYFKLTPTGMLHDFVSEHPSRGLYALDIGCGNGRNMSALVAAEYQAFGMDISEQAIATAQRYVPEGHYFKCDVISLPFPSGMFSLVYCGTVLSCLDSDSIKLAMGEFRRVVTPGGYLLFSDFSTKDPGAIDTRSGDASECAPAVRHYFTKEELVVLFTGFTIERLWEVEKFDDSHGTPHHHALLRMIARREKDVR
jgi:ubiquinone/menaquinone biosynthesis C-methylase UbiE